MHPRPGAAARVTPRRRGGPEGAWSSPSSSGSAGVAVGVAGGFAALEAGLVHPQPAEVVAVREEPGVGGQPALRPGGQLAPPGPDPARVEDVVPDGVQAVGDIDPPAVAADLDHLRAATKWLVGGGRGGPSGAGK